MDVITTIVIVFVVITAAGLLSVPALVVWLLFRRYEQKRCARFGGHIWQSKKSGKLVCRSCGKKHRRVTKVAPERRALH